MKDKESKKMYVPFLFDFQPILLIDMNRFTDEINKK